MVNSFRTDEMPGEMRILLEEYPRDSWPRHPGFKQKTSRWLAAHRMFRQISETLINDAERYLDGNKDAKEYVDQLIYRGGSLVGNLNGHHSWEDHSYFPELSAADPHFDEGLEILEQDHVALNGVLSDFTNTAIRAIRLIDLNDSKARSEVGQLHTVTIGIEKLLQRHLGDEEELAVPIILHHRLRG